MLPKNLFKKPMNTLENAYEKLTKTAAPDVPSEMCTSCPECRAMLFSSDLSENNNVCPKCGHHFRINARQRISMIADEGTFQELYGELRSKNVIGFPNYDKKLKHAYLDSAERESVVCGTAEVGGWPCCLFVMEPYFMMGSMGTVAGEKITRIFEYATVHHLPVIGFTVSGGARMQEGILSLMQMAKTSAALERFSQRGGLYISVFTHPTTGGVTASFASLGDVILSEPGALIGFAGPRVIEQTIGEKLPEGFQTAEYLLEHGFLDAIVPRPQLRTTLLQILKLHGKGGDEHGK